MPVRIYKHLLQIQICDPFHYRFMPVVNICKRFMVQRGFLFPCFNADVWNLLFYNQISLPLPALQVFLQQNSQEELLPDTQPAARQVPDLPSSSILLIPVLPYPVCTQNSALQKFCKGLPQWPRKEPFPIQTVLYSMEFQGQVLSSCLPERLLQHNILLP